MRHSERRECEFCAQEKPKPQSFTQKALGRALDMVNSIFPESFNSTCQRRQKLASFKQAALDGVSALVLAGILSAGALAQNEEFELEEIIVTAQKREQSLNDVPISLTVLGTEQLAERGLEKIDDLGLVVPGFSYTESRVGTPIYTLRGVGFNDIALGGRPTVSVYHDEAPVPFTIMTRGGFVDIERVEVLNGPQGTLFGNNATGGGINLIAKKPTDEFEAGLEFGYGNFEAITLAGHVSGPLSDTLKFRVAARHNQDSGFQENFVTGEPNAAVNLTTGRMLLEWTPSERLSVNVNLNGFVDRSEGQAPRLASISPIDPLLIMFFPEQTDNLLSQPVGPENNRAVDFTDSDYTRDNSYFQANVRIDYDLTDDLTLTSLSSYNTYDMDQTVDVDGGSFVSLEQRTVGEIESFFQEVRIAGNLTDQLYFVLGANIADDETNELNIDDFSESFIGFAAGAPALNIVNDSEIFTYAFFGSFEYSLSDSVTLQGGLRYTESDNDFSGCTIAVGPVTSATFGVPDGGCLTLNTATFTPGLVTSNLTEDNVSWRVGVDWKPSDDALIYGNVSRGYKAGGYPLLAAVFSPQLDPTTQEKVTAYEAGFKVSVSNAMQLNGAVYYYDYVDQQLLGFLPIPPFGNNLTLINVPQSEVRGAELQMSWQPYEGLRINTAASYVDTEVTESFVTPDALQVDNELLGESIPNTPKWQFSGDVSYTWPVSNDTEAFVGTSLSSRSSTNAEFGEIPQLDIDGYTLLDLRAGVQSMDGRWQLSAWMRNIGNTFYTSNATITSDTVVQYTGQPRRYGVTLTYNFGG